MLDWLLGGTASLSRDEFLSAHASAQATHAALWARVDALSSTCHLQSKVITELAQRLRTVETQIASNQGKQQ